MVKTLRGIVALLGLWALLAAAAEPQPPLLTQSLPGKGMDQATQALVRSIVSHNYSFVRLQAIDSRLVPQNWEAKSVRIVYFCNFAKMDQALALDKRATQLLPCRITLVETAQGVDLIAVNPAWVSQHWGASPLHEACLALKRDYLAILEEASL